MKYIFTNALIVTGASSKKGALVVNGDRIEKIIYTEDYGSDESLNDPQSRIIDLEGKILMAGGIDAHVHFREPGMTHKADIQSESLAAVLGGVTSFVDMPNTNPPTISIDRIKEKQNMADGRSFANYGFNIGCTNSNFDDVEDSCMNSKETFGAVKVFMGSSTGNMLVDNESALDRIFRIKPKPVFVHSEDENTIRENTEKAKQQFGTEIPFELHPHIRSRQACIKSTIKALEDAIKFGTKLHILHVSTAEEVEMIRAAKIHNPGITAETSPNYLWFSDNDYQTMGGRLKCNPAVKSDRDRQALRRAIKEGIIDTIGSDHAPHLPEEKNETYLRCPSGLPSIQQMISVLFTVARQEEISETTIAGLISENIARIMDIQERGRLEEGYYADLIVIDPKQSFTVGKAAGISSSEGINYKCGWSPYKDELLYGAIKYVMVNGVMQVENGQLITGSEPCGMALRF